MFRSTLIAATALAAVASAQNVSTLMTLVPTDNTTYFFNDGELAIDPNAVEASLRTDWCTGQTNNCPEICDQQVTTNTCEEDTLEFECVCADSSLQPNISSFDAMMPSYICQQWIDFCVYDHPDNRTGQQSCRSIACGNLDPESGDEVDPDSTATTTSPSSSETPSPTATGDDNEASATPSESADNDGAAAALNLAQAYGSSILAAGLLGIFGMAL